MSSWIRVGYSVGRTSDSVVDQAQFVTSVTPVTLPSRPRRPVTPCCPCKAQQSRPAGQPAIRRALAGFHSGRPPDHRLALFSDPVGCWHRHRLHQAQHRQEGRRTDGRLLVPPVSTEAASQLRRPSHQDRAAAGPAHAPRRLRTPQPEVSHRCGTSAFHRSGQAASCGLRQRRGASRQPPEKYHGTSCVRADVMPQMQCMSVSGFVC